MTRCFVYLFTYNCSFSDSLKLTNLHDYYQRLLHGSQPVPSGLDMANTVKFFSQMLLCNNRNIVLSVSVENRLIIYALFHSSVKRSSRSTFRNDQVSEVRRRTYGSLPEFGLQTAVQRAHSADRCCFLYSHRFARSVLYFVFIRSFAIQNACFSVWTGIASVSRVSLAFFGPRYDRQCTLSHGQLDLGTSSGTSSRYRQLSLFLHSTIHHQ